ncbi:alpha-amylase 2-like [Schistocerca serialis cubense]|uniref:alpha-amylase 2-like n=1 Tax=Schistocerca serialis cubense TaxID=2023355 RepID=UPI00214F32CF|nr:alpha-amylase 2-like [Schistocerca serialis cubense]
MLATVAALAVLPALLGLLPLPAAATIVHLLEWKFADIARECEQFLPHWGYTAVQTSPVSEHLWLPERGHPWWERYQPVSYRIASRSGDRAEFQEMVRRCNAAGISIYVDAVLNHMTAVWGNITGSGGSFADTEARKYPAVPYDTSNFHEPCNMTLADYGENAKPIRMCRLSGMHDLDHRQPYVRQMIVAFLNKLIDDGVAGFRIDAAKHIWPTDLALILDKLKNLNTEHGFPEGQKPFIYQEVIDLSAPLYRGWESVKKTEYISLGRVTEFKYGEEISKTFRRQNALKWYKTFGPKWSLLDSEDAIVFIDNHDNQRGHGGGGATILTHKSRQLYTMAVGFMLAWPYGIPRVMSSYNFTDSDDGPPSDPSGEIRTVAWDAQGQCTGGWVCEHRWPAIRGMAQFRRAVLGTNVTNWWDNGGYQIAFCRGDRGFVVFNNELTNMNASLQTCLPAGTYCDVVSGGGTCAGETLKVTANGSVRVRLQPHSFLAIHVDLTL